MKRGSRQDHFKASGLNLDPRRRVNKWDLVECVETAKSVWCLIGVAVRDGEPILCEVRATAWNYPGRQKLTPKPDKTNKNMSLKYAQAAVGTLNIASHGLLGVGEGAWPESRIISAPAAASSPTVTTSKTAKKSKHKTLAIGP